VASVHHFSRTYVVPAGSAAGVSCVPSEVPLLGLCKANLICHRSFAQTSRRRQISLVVIGKTVCAKLKN
jgi:hypothetical protein